MLPQEKEGQSRLGMNLMSYIEMPNMFEYFLLPFNQIYRLRINVKIDATFAKGVVLFLYYWYAPNFSSVYLYLYNTRHKVSVLQIKPNGDEPEGAWNDKTKIIPNSKAPMGTEFSKIQVQTIV